MTGSDSEPGVLSEDSDHESERGSECSKESDKDAISLQEGGSDSDVDESTQHQQLTAEELIAGAQAISSDEDEGPHYSSNSQSRQLSDREEGEDVSASSSPRKEPVEVEQEPPAKKQKSSSREDLEDGELTSDSEEEEQKDKETSPKNDRLKRDHPRIDFPRFPQNHVPPKRRRPEDYGICKFYLRGNCTWDRTCKYAHPVGAEKTLWLAECGLPDPSMNVPRFRKNTDEKTKSPESRSRSPRNLNNRVNSFERKRSNSRRSNGSQSSPRVKESPRASPISSNGSRSQSLEDRKKNSRRRSRSPSAISSDDSRPRSRRSRSRNSGASSPGRRRARSTSSESGSSRSRSGSPINQRAETTLGALLRKKRLESMQHSESPEKKKPRQKSPSPDDRPQTRDEAIRRLFTKNPDNEPEVYKKRPRKSPTPQSISDDGSDNESIPDPRSESPFPASAHV